MDDELRAILDKLVQGQESLTRGQDVLALSVERLEQGQESLTRGQAVLALSVERLEQGQESLTRGQDVLALSVERLEQGQESLTRGQDVLALSVERLEQGQVELRTVMMERFERVEDKLTSMREDVSVNMMAITREGNLRRAERESADQLAGMVMKMEQQILRLQTDVDELRKGQ